MTPEPDDSTTNATPGTNPPTGYGAQFAPTSWTDVLAAQRGGSVEAEAALEKLCCTYWYPLYAYLRRKGFDPHKAQDLNQEFFYRLVTSAPDTPLPESSAHNSDRCGEPQRGAVSFDGSGTDASQRATRPECLTQR